MNDKDLPALVAGELHLTLGELAHRTGVDAERLLAMIDEGILEPVAGSHMASWRFATESICRITTVLRLQRDLHINLAGAALALQLLEEIDTLSNRVRTLEQLLFNE